MLKCKHEWHCAFSSETGTCIIKDAGRQAAHKKTTKIHVLYSRVEGKYLLSTNYQTQQLNL